MSKSLRKEARKRRRQNTLIQKELSKYSWKTIRAFEEVFPCMMKRYKIEVLPSEVIQFGYGAWPNYYTAEIIHYTTPDDFWKRWNRFKNLRSFL